MAAPLAMEVGMAGEEIASIIGAALVATMVHTIGLATAIIITMEAVAVAATLRRSDFQDHQSVRGHGSVSRERTIQGQMAMMMVLGATTVGDITLVISTVMATTIVARPAMAIASRARHT